MGNGSEDRREKGLGSLRERPPGSKCWQFKYTKDHHVFFETVRGLTETAAKKALKDFVKRVDDGAVERQAAAAAALSAQPTLGEWSETYLNEYMRLDSGETSTRQTYTAAFKHFQDDLRARKLSELTEDMLHNWLRGLRQRGRRTTQGSPGLSHSTIRLIRAAVSSCLSKAVKRKLIASNPTPRMSDLNMGDGVSASETARRSALSAAQIGAIQSQVKDGDLLLWLRILGATGLRPGEATALTWGDIDFTQRVIRVRHSAKRGSVRGQGRLGTTKTKKSMRDVPMGSGLMAVLQRAQAEIESTMRELIGLPEGVAPMRPLVEPDMCLFYAGLATKETRGAPRPVATLRSQFKAAAVRAGLPASTVPHALRHSAITAMLAGDAVRPGVSVVDAAQIAGHARPSVTSDIYAHAVAANLSRGAELADALIASPAPAQVESLPRTK